MTTDTQKIPRLALIGVTGYGGIYWRYVRDMMAAGTAQLVAAVVINPDEASSAVAEMEDHGSRVYSCYKEMMAAEAGKVDLCLIPTGIAWHARMTVAALKAGMNVLVEKPLAGSLADARAIREEEARSGRWVAVGFQDMYCHETMWLKRVLCNGGIGEIKRVKMVGLWPRPVSYFRRNHWAGELKADGALVLDSPLNNAFAHFVNLSFFLAGKEPESSADVQPKTANLWRAHAIETFDTGLVQGESADGVVFEFFVSHACPVAREPEIRIEGTSGFAEWHHEGPVSFFPEGRDPTICPLPGNFASRRAMFEAAMAKLTDPTVFVCSSAMAEKHTAFIDALHRFAEIRDISPDEIEWTAGTDNSGATDMLPTVRGIDDAFSQAALKSEAASDAWLRQPGLFEAVTKFKPVCMDQQSSPAFPA